jgi:5'-methylthioadenosine phosphorylase
MPESALAIIGGSEAHRLLAKKNIVGERLGTRKTPFGTSQSILRVEKDGLGYFFMPRHGEHGYETSAPFVNYRANIYALKELGVGSIIAWSGPGAIRESLKVGQFVIPDDLIDQTHRHPQTFFENKGAGFIRQFPVFCPTLRGVLENALKGLRIPFDSVGTYVCTEGPRLETPAEIRMFRQAGADLVGMTLCPEVFLAKELEMCYAAVCYVTNYAEGVKKTDFAPGKLFEGLANADERAAGRDAVGHFPDIIDEVAAGIAGAKRVCVCDKAMSRYVQTGRLEKDWKKWFK